MHIFECGWRFNVNWEKIKSIILSLTCHGLRNFPPFIHIPLYPFVNFWKTYQLLFFWVRVTHKNVECELHENSLNNFICHLSWLKKLSPTYTHPLVSIREFLKAYKLLFFWVRVTLKKLNVTCIQIHSIICHLSWFKKLSPTHTHPLISIREFFDTLSVIIFWVRVTHKMLNVNCMKIHSIIFICHLS